MVGRVIASHEGFAYSSAMKDFSEGGTLKWDYEHLDKFLTSPKGLVKGTAMGFAGIKKAQDRADLVAYLNTLSDSPLPVPAADAAPAAEGAAAPAGEAPAASPAGGAEPNPAAPAPTEGGAAEPQDGAAIPAAGEIDPTAKKGSIADDSI